MLSCYCRTNLDHLKITDTRVAEVAFLYILITSFHSTHGLFSNRRNFKFDVKAEAMSQPGGSPLS